MSNAEPVTETSGDLILFALRTAGRPLGVADIVKIVRADKDVRLVRQSVYGVLNRLVAESPAVYKISPGSPRRWVAIST